LNRRRVDPDPVLALSTRIVDQAAVPLTCHRTFKSSPEVRERQAAVWRSIGHAVHFMVAKPAKPGCFAQLATKSPCRHAEGLPIINGAPPVRRAARRSRGAFGASRAGAKFPS